MGEHIIKCRGLPWSTTAKDIVSFFHDCNIQNGESGVHLPLDKNGRASGECFVELASAQDVQTAKGHDKEHMGSRYVEISESERQEMDWAMNRASGGGGGGGGSFGGGGGSEFVVKLRGLPYSATKKDIVDFFSGIQVNQYGITVITGGDGRPSGEAFVELTSSEDVEQACSKNRETIGSRYIEIFKSNKQEIQFASNSSGGGGGGGYGGGGRGGGGGGPMRGGRGGGRAGPYDRPGGMSSSHGAAHALGPSGFNTAGMVTRSGGGGGRGGRGGAQMGGGGGGGGGDNSSGSQPSTTGFMIHMRGLPFEATQGDVFKFFAPLNPVEVRILFEDSGRAKGQCDVDFSSYQDVESAMQKDKQNMGHRYIELFKRCEDSMRGGGGGGGWGNNSGGPMLPQNRNGPGAGGWGGPGGNGGGPPQPPNMQQGYGGGYGPPGGNGGYNMGGGAGGYGGGYGGGNGYGGGDNQGPPQQQNSGYGNFNDNKQGYQMPQAAGGYNY